MVDTPAAKLGGVLADALDSLMKGYEGDHDVQVTDVVVLYRTTYDEGQGTAEALNWQTNLATDEQVLDVLGEAKARFEESA